MIWKALESKNAAEGGQMLAPFALIPRAWLFLLLGLVADGYNLWASRRKWGYGACLLWKLDLLDSKTFQIFNHPFCRTAPSELHSAKTFLLHEAVPVSLFPSTTEVGSLPLPMGKLFFSRFFFWYGQGQCCWWLQSCPCSLLAGGSKCSSKADFFSELMGNFKMSKWKMEIPRRQQGIWWARVWMAIMNEQPE